MTKLYLTVTNDTIYLESPDFGSMRMHHADGVHWYDVQYDIDYYVETCHLYLDSLTDFCDGCGDCEACEDLASYRFESPERVKFVRSSADGAMVLETYIY